MIEIIGAIILTLFACNGMLLRYAPFSGCLAPAQKKRIFFWDLAISFVNFLILSWLLLHWHIEGAFLYLRYGVVAFSAVQTVVHIFLIPGRTREHLFVCGVVVTFNYLLMSIPNYVISCLSGGTHWQYLLTIVVIYGLLLAVTFFPLRRLLCTTVEPFLHMQVGGYWNTIWFIPIALFGTRFLFAGGQHDEGSIRQLLSSGLTASVIVLICLSVSADHVRIRQRQNLEQQLTDQKLYYKQLQTRVEDARKTRHDLRHHMAAIAHLVELDDKEGVRNYCSDLLGSVDRQERIPYTGNMAADGVLYHYQQRAKAERVELKCAGTIVSHGIPDMDLCVLLGNALDNALTAAQNAPGQRTVQMISQAQEKLLTIVIRNTFDGQVQQQGDTLLSRKRQNAPGVGIQSMRSVCERYEGDLELTWDADTFTAVILLPLKEEP